MGARQVWATEVGDIRHKRRNHIHTHTHTHTYTCAQRRYGLVKLGALGGKKDETVLVHSAAGGVGLACLEIGPLYPMPKPRA